MNVAQCREALQNQDWVTDQEDIGVIYAIDSEGFCSVSWLCLYREEIAFLGSHDPSDLSPISDDDAAKIIARQRSDASNHPTQLLLNKLLAAKDLT